MAVIVIDEEQEATNQEEQSQQQPQQPEQSPPADPPKDGGQPAPADELPEKFRGKSAADIARSYSELERNLGRQAQELGELRKTHDEFIRSALARKETATPPGSNSEQDDDTEFFVNPRAAVKKMLQEDEVIKELRAHKAESQQERNARLIRERHPDAIEIVNDPAFQEWIVQSPVRQSMFVQAHKNYDAAVGDELLSTWKELKGAKASAQKAQATAEQQAAEEAKRQTRDAQHKAGVMPTGSASPEAGDGKKVYRRVDLVRMMMNDPEKYASMNDEILAAYAEGRVR